MPKRTCELYMSRQRGAPKHCCRQPAISDATGAGTGNACGQTALLHDVEKRSTSVDERLMDRLPLKNHAKRGETNCPYSSLPGIIPAHCQCSREHIAALVPPSTGLPLLVVDGALKIALKKACL
ncbi:MAG: hypothetical protein ACLULL_06245 [Parabacteroides distasonis]